MRADTTLLLSNGSAVRAGDVRVGMRLLGPHGGMRRVLACVSFVADTALVKPTRGDIFTVASTHPLSLVGTGRAPKSAKEKKTEFGCTRVGGVATQVLAADWCSWSNKRRHMFKLWRSNQVVFPVGKPLPIDPYFLGVIIGDGSLLQTVTITTMDSEIVEELRRQAKLWNVRVEARSGSKSKATSYALSGSRFVEQSQELRKELRELGLLGHGAGDKFVPDHYKTASPRDRMLVLAGLLDTDGAANKTAYDFISKSKRLSCDVAFMARSIGAAATVTPCVKRCQTGASGTYWRVGISGDVVRNIPCLLNRKRLPERKQKKSVLRTGVEITLTKQAEPCVSLVVDKDGLLVLSDFTVVPSGASAEQGIQL